MQKFFLGLSLLFVFSLKAFAGASEIQIGNEVFSLKKLRKEFKEERFEVFHPVYAKKMSYRGVRLNQVLEQVFGEKELAKRRGQTVLFDCRDKYVSKIPLEKLRGLDLWIAFTEAPSEASQKILWSPVLYNGKMIDPGPFYVLGQTPNSYGTIPWPYQVTRIGF